MKKREKLVFFIFIIFFWFFSLNSQEYIAIERMEFNTNSFDEFGPSYFKDGILYSSNKMVNIVQNIKTKDQNFTFDVYYYNLKDSEDTSVYVNIKKILERINTPYNDGPIVYFNEKYYISQNYDVRKGKKYIAPVGIFIYSFMNDSLIKIDTFPFNKNSYRLGHACIAENGKKLYFSSDMPDGYGGFDIYEVEIEDGKFKNLKNLGNTVNTEFDETFPFFVGNRLYFSSNRNNYQYDIYYSELEKDNISSPIRLPGPINTDKYNDFAFICDSTYENGFFTSDRKGTDDIYKFYSTLPSFSSCDTIIPEELCYHFVDETSLYIDTLPVKYLWDMGDSTLIEGWEVDHCYKDYGTYEVKLTMIDTLTNEKQVVDTYIMELVKPIQPFITYNKPIKLNEEIEFDASLSYFPDCTILDYIWMFNDGFKQKGIKCKRTFTKKGTVIVKLGVIAKCNELEIKKCSYIVLDVN